MTFYCLVCDTWSKVSKQEKEYFINIFSGNNNIKLTCKKCKTKWMGQISYQEVDEGEK